MHCFVDRCLCFFFVIVLSVLRFTGSDYLFAIFKLFLQSLYPTCDVILTFLSEYDAVREQAKWANDIRKLPLRRQLNVHYSLNRFIKDRDNWVSRNKVRHTVIEGAEDNSVPLKTNECLENKL